MNQFRCGFRHLIGIDILYRYAKLCKIDTAVKEMKIGGYGYNLDVLKTLVQLMSPLLLLFFNIMFYMLYPVTLARLLLSALPKKGNLSVAANF